MNKIWMIGACVVALSVAGARAEGDVNPEKNPPASKPQLKELNLEGVIHKIEHKKQNGSVVITLRLVLDDGTLVSLPKGKGALTANLESAIGLRVRIVGTGFEMEKNGKKRAGFQTIKSAEKVDVPAAAAATPAN